MGAHGRRTGIVPRKQQPPRIADRRNFLMRISLLRDRVESFGEYPFNIPAIRGLDELDFDRPVTFFIGENGAGKSTLLEAIAVGSGTEPGARQSKLQLFDARVPFRVGECAAPEP